MTTKKIMMDVFDILSSVSDCDIKDVNHVLTDVLHYSEDSLSVYEKDFILDTLHFCEKYGMTDKVGKRVFFQNHLGVPTQPKELSTEEKLDRAVRGLTVMYKIIIDTQEELNNTKDLCSLIHDSLSEKSAKEDPEFMFYTADCHGSPG